MTEYDYGVDPEKYINNDYADDCDWSVNEEWNNSCGQGEKNAHS